MIASNWLVSLFDSTGASGQASVRLGVGTAVGVVAAATTGALGHWDLAASIGWDVAALVFLTWTWWAIRHMDAAATRTHATREDPGKVATRLILLTASVASLAAVGYLLVQARADEGAARALVAALALVTVAISWLMVHTVFMLNYALLYYSAPDGPGQGDRHRIDFNQDEPPRYIDFAYFAFTIGMTFQVSDTEVVGHVIRGAILRHAFLSYVFGSFILGGSVNLIASLAGA